jgi:hypothetical protein
MEMWNAFMAFDAVHSVEGGLIDAIRRGELNASPGPDLDARLRKWSEYYARKIWRAEAATQLLINTLSSKLHTISDVSVRNEISHLVGVTMAFKTALIPLPVDGSGAAQDMPLPRQRMQAQRD